MTPFTPDSQFQTRSQVLAEMRRLGREASAALAGGRDPGPFYAESDRLAERYRVGEGMGLLAADELPAPAKEKLV